MALTRASPGALVHFLSFCATVAPMGMGAANDAFDVGYLALEAACVVVWLLAFLGVLRRPWIVLAVAAFAGVALPLFWDVVWPPTSGIEGAGRVLLGAPPSLLNALVGAIAAGRLLRRPSLARAALRVAPVPFASAAYWLWLLFS